MGATLNVLPSVGMLSASLQGRPPPSPLNPRGTSASSSMVILLWGLWTAAPTGSASLAWTPDTVVSPETSAG